MATNRIDAQRPDAPELAAYGKYAIGVRTIQLNHADQIDIAAIDPEKTQADRLPRYNRPLTVEVWYPAIEGAAGSTTLHTYLRNGKTRIVLEGKAVRDAMPSAIGAPYPLIIISHGYPGNRFLLSHLAENLASKGYVVASIDHTDSTYDNQLAFGSTLINRPLDQKFVLDEMARITADPDSFLHRLVNADETGLIGYSMGGYGAVISAGGGLAPSAIDATWSAPLCTLAMHESGSESHAALPDPRFKTVIAFAPWGMSQGAWSPATLAGIKIPMLIIAGSVDDVSGYEDGPRAIWKAAVNVDRALLTYENANHNAGAPIPSPAEGYGFDATLGFAPFEHYADPVWDNVRMNNIAQHFATAWMGKHLKGDGAMDAFLDLVPHSNDRCLAE